MFSLDTWFYLLMLVTALLGLLTMARILWDKLRGEVVDRVEPAQEGDLEIRMFETRRVKRVDAGDGPEAGV